MSSTVEALLAESIVLRRLLVRPLQGQHHRVDVGTLERETAAAVETAARVIRGGGRPAVLRRGFGDRPEEVPFVFSAFDAWEADSAFARTPGGFRLALGRLVADCLLVRRFLLDPVSCRPEARQVFLAESRRAKPDLVRLLQGVVEGAVAPEALGGYWHAALPRPEKYLDPFFPESAASPPSSKVGAHWAKLLMEGTFDERRASVDVFGGVLRTRGVPLVLRGRTASAIEVQVSLEPVQGAGASAPALLAFTGRGVEFESWGEDLERLDEGTVVSKAALLPPWSGTFRLGRPAGETDFACYILALAADQPLEVSTTLETTGDRMGWLGEAPPRLRWWLAAQMVAAQQVLRRSTARKLQVLRAEVQRVAQTPWRIAGHARLREMAESEDLVGPKRRLALTASTREAYETAGAEGAVAHLAQRAPGLAQLSQVMQDVAEDIGSANPEAALKLFWMAYGADPRPLRAQSIAGKLFKSGDLSSTGALFNYRDPKMTRYKGEMRLSVALHEQGVEIPPRSEAGAVSKGGTVAYVASSALPFQVSGYTIRTHQLLTALNGAGLEAACFVRPGYPHDRLETIQTWPEEAKAHADHDYQVEGVRYHTTAIAGVEVDSERFIERMSDALVERFTKARPCAVHAASNYRNALPALIAARRVGVPFVYEVRGLWELTAASRMQGWESTERFRLDRAMETRVAVEADHVLTITQGVAAELIAGGVPAEAITILPNAVDPDLFKPLPRDEALAAELGTAGAFTLVYAGSLTVYEGLDELIAAIGLLRQGGIPARLVIVGDGPYRATLERRAVELALESAITFTGRTAPGDVSRYLSLADTVALPRKSFAVCKVVSPLKPFEAMAMAKPVVLTDLPALREIVDHDVTGLIAAPDDPVDLARTLRRLAVEPELRSRLGAAGRRWVVEERSWSANAQVLKRVYAERLGLRVLSSAAA